LLSLVTEKKKHKKNNSPSKFNETALLLQKKTQLMSMGHVLVETKRAVERNELREARFEWILQK
jgi:hypothetical protein